jgi:hypothetical protein
MRPASSGIQTCIPLADACTHHDRATASVTVTTSDLARDGIDIVIRGGAFAQRKKATYAGSVRRKGLCSGLRFGSFVNGSGSHIETLTYFLDTPS